MIRGVNQNIEPSLDHLRDWIGRTEQRTDRVTDAPLAALIATLDRDDPPPGAGTEVPPLGHWLYFLPMARQSEIGPDGHPRRGGFLPPVPLPRRMWAGSRLTFHRPLRVGDEMTRVSSIKDVGVKHGRSGALVFVTVRHEIAAANGVAITEEHDIVYRDNPQPGAAAPEPQAAPTNQSFSRDVVPDSVLLFRYSALTFNGHRIHYDLPYCTGEEHYPGLVVHGPLQSTLLLDLCRRHGTRPVRHFDYRAMSPIFHMDPFSVNGTPSADGSTADVWTANATGGLAMTAKVRFA